MFTNSQLGFIARQTDLDRFAAALAREEDPNDHWAQVRAESTTGVFIQDMSSSEIEYVGQQILKKRGF